MESLEKSFIGILVLQNLSNQSFGGIDIEKLLTRPKDPKHGDWSLPCFQLAKESKTNPAEYSRALSEKLNTQKDLLKELDAIEPVGPYINFSLKRSFWNEKTIRHILSDGESVGKRNALNDSWVLEYSSPNIAKTFHVGHLRTTLIGLSLERVLRHLGHTVHTVNHLGDWGTQFGFVWAGCELFGRPQNPTVDELVDIYIQATTLRKQQDEKKVPPEHADKPNLNEMARGYFIRLEAGNEDAVNFWKWCLDISLKYLKGMYARLGIFFDHYTGESFYKDMVPDVEERVRKSGILEESDGALGVDLGKELGFVRIFADDGRSLYITRDIAAAMYRHEHFKPEKNLYVVAAQQSLHFKQLIAVMAKMNHPSAKEMVHIPFGFVPGMKTRGGGAISLKDFLDESYSKALEAYRTAVTKRPDGLNEEDIAEKVAIGATYFYFLSHSNIKDFNFRWEEALTFQGDTGPYCQYAVARLNSIIDKATSEGIKPVTDDRSFGELLVDDASHSLVSLLSRFEVVLSDVERTFEPNILADYIISLTHQFSSSYKHLRVIGAENSEISSARLTLLISLKNTLSTALYLIGVPVVQKM